MQDLDYSYISACSFCPMSKTFYFYNEGTKYQFDYHQESIQSLIKEWRILGVLYEDNLQNYCLFIPVKEKIFYNHDMNCHIKKIFTTKRRRNKEFNFYYDSKDINNLLKLQDVSSCFRSYNGMCELELKTFTEKILVYKNYRELFEENSKKQRSKDITDILKEYISKDIVYSIINDFLESFYYLNDIECRIRLERNNSVFNIMYSETRGLYYAIPIHFIKPDEILYFEVLLDNTILYTYELNFELYKHVTGKGNWKMNISKIYSDIQQSYKIIKKI